MLFGVASFWQGVDVPGQALRHVVIVRIPFGPKRYLRKTKLWPYLDMFVDQCLNYFQRTRRNGGTAWGASTSWRIDSSA